MFSIFSSEKKILNTGLLDGMIDIHSHLLPAVDDGMPSLEKSLEAVKWLESVGIKEIWLTPHNMDVYPENNRSSLLEKFNHFVSDCASFSSIQFHLAGEYMLDLAFMDRLNEKPYTLGSSHVLIETSYMSAPPNFLSMLYEISLAGYTPILAHPERYVYMDESDYASMKDRGCLFQMNLMSLSGVYGSMAMKKSKKFLKEGRYDLIGTDIHRLSVFKKTLDVLKVSKKEIEALQALLHNNKQIVNQ